MKPDLTKLHIAARELSRDEWADRLLDGAEGSRDDVPPMPDVDVQRLTNGLCGAKTILPATTWYRYFWSLLERHGITVPDDAQMLDVGCGWGRMLRMFLRDFPPEHLAGVDVDSRLIAASQETLPGGRFACIEPREPLPFRDHEFDLVINNSLFSHLAPPQHLHTLGQIARVTKPGGVVVSTTFSRRHLTILVGHRDLPGPWSSLGDPVEALERFDAGEFVFGRTREGQMAEYGLAIIPDVWLMEHWQGRLDVIAIDHQAPGQSVVLACKPTAKESVDPERC